MDISDFFIYFMTLCKQRNLAWFLLLWKNKTNIICHRQRNKKHHVPDESTSIVAPGQSWTRFTAAPKKKKALKISTLPPMFTRNKPHVCVCCTMSPDRYRKTLKCRHAALGLMFLLAHEGSRRSARFIVFRFSPNNLFFASTRSALLVRTRPIKGLSSVSTNECGWLRNYSLPNMRVVLSHFRITLAHFYKTIYVI